MNAPARRKAPDSIEAYIRWQVAIDPAAGREAFVFRMNSFLEGGGNLLLLLLPIVFSCLCCCRCWSARPKTKKIKQNKTKKADQKVNYFFHFSLLDSCFLIYWLILLAVRLLQIIVPDRSFRYHQLLTGRVCSVYLFFSFISFLITRLVIGTRRLLDLFILYIWRVTN